MVITQEIIDELVEKLVEFSPKDLDIKPLEQEYNCVIDISIEKHNALQYTYYYNIDFDDMEENYFIEVESGINNGTQINDEGWGWNYGHY